MLTRRVIVFLGILISCYVHARAYLLAFTYDECWTYGWYAQQPLIDLVLNTDPAANNHILHSILMKWCLLAFGQVEYFLRLPVIMAHFIYLLFTYRILNEFFPKWLLIGFILLNFQPYLLDYFVTARGYGMAISFTILSIYYLIKFNTLNKNTYAFWAILFAGLAAYSNFTYSLIFLSVLGIVSYLVILNKKWVPKTMGALFIMTLMVLLIVGYPMFQVLKAGQFYYGGTVGFWNDTILSIVNHGLYKMVDNDLLLAIIGGVLILAIFYALILIVVNKLKKENLTILFLFLFLPMLGSIAQHHLFDKPYLIDRTVLFSIPLFILLLIATLDYVKSIWVSRTIAAISGGFIVFIFVLSFNFDYQLDFKEHADTKRAMIDMSENIGQASLKPFYLGKSTYMNTTINFYKDRLGLDYVTHSELTFCNDGGPYPYYYIFGGDLDCLNHLEVEQLSYYPVSDTYLLKNKDYKEIN